MTKQHPENHGATVGDKPLLIYDGSCGLCCEGVDRLRRLVGDEVDFRPSSELASSFPEISHAEFDRAVQLIRSDGSRASGAEAILEAASSANFTLGLVLRAYHRSVAVRSLFDAVYGFIAARRRGIFRKRHKPE